jgi:hypothetical protein
MITDAGNYHSVDVVFVPTLIVERDSN